MIQKLISAKPARWYNRDGEPVYQVPCKSKEGMKDVTVREAQEMNLLPSVTTILQMMAKPELEAWKLEQAIMAALTLPRLDNEPIDNFAKRVIADMERQSTEAAEFGSQIHAAIAAHLMGDIPAIRALPETVMPWLAEFIKWQDTIGLIVYATEFVVVNEYHGYAGTLDLHGKIDWPGIGECIVDFKTQKVKNGKPVFYPEWGMQLAAYRGCFSFENIACVSIVVDSTAPRVQVLKVWEDIGECMNAFLNTHGLWCFRKKYYPGTGTRGKI